MARTSEISHLPHDALAGAVELDVVLVVALEGAELVRGALGQRPQDVDRLEVVGDEAAGGDLDRAAARVLDEADDRLAGRGEAEEGLRLEQERPVG